MKFFLKILLINISFLFSCREKKEIVIGNSPNKDTYKISLIDDNEHNQLDLDTLLKIRSIAKLETTSDMNSLIVDYTKVKIMDSMIFILDYKFKGLKVYDLKGNYIRLIGKIGEGPGEYIGINDFDITGDTIKILSTDQQMIQYDLQGNYLTTQRINMFAWNFVTIQNNYTFFLNYNAELSDKSYNLVVTDNQFNVVNKGAPFSERDGNIPTFAYTGFLEKVEEDILFSEAFSKSINTLEDGRLIEKYAFDFGEFAKPDDISLSEVSNKGLDPAHIGTEIFETNRFLFFDYFIAPKLRLGIYDRQANRLYTKDKFVKNYLSFIFSVPKASIDSKTFISIAPVELIVYLQKNEEFLTSLKTGNASLYKTIIEYKKSDNPLVLTYNFSK